MSRSCVQNTPQVVVLHISLDIADPGCDGSGRGKVGCAGDIVNIEGGGELDGLPAQNRLI
jgi:hypothetical protein